MIPPRLVAVGRITHAHGVKGEVSVRPLSQVPARLQPGSTLFAGEDEARELVVTATRPHRDRLLVTFRGVGDRDQARELTGTYLFVRAADSPPLPEGEYWTHQLVGCSVLTDGGRPLGQLSEVIHTPANDVWVVLAQDGSEILVPALKDVVGEVDPNARRVVIHEVPGLTAPA